MSTEITDEDLIVHLLGMVAGARYEMRVELGQASALGKHRRFINTTTSNGSHVESFPLPDAKGAVGVTILLEDAFPGLSSDDMFLTHYHRTIWLAGADQREEQTTFGQSSAPPHHQQQTETQSSTPPFPGYHADEHIEEPKVEVISPSMLPLAQRMQEADRLYEAMLSQGRGRIGGDIGGEQVRVEGAPGTLGTAYAAAKSGKQTRGECMCVRWIACACARTHNLVRMHSHQTKFIF